MSSKRARTIPCADCAEWQEDLALKGFLVHGCIPDAASPGFCTIVFEERAGEEETEATVAVAAPLAALSAVAPTEAAAEGHATAAGLTSTQEKAAQAIVNIFETGDVLGDYSQVTVISGDSGHLTFGRSQTTLGSGNLARLLKQYCANPGARFAARLAPYLPRFEARDFGLDGDRKLHNILRASADDRVMRDTQDAFFDAVYWRPALRAAAETGIRSPLGIAVVYDSFIHGSWGPMRSRTNQKSGTVDALGEQDWIAAYVAHRKQWLETHQRSDLRPTVYRMDAFQRLIDQGWWGLALPLVVRGREISSHTLNAMPPGCFEGPLPGSRPLSVQSPLLRGLDVRLMQLGLSEHGIDIRADGVFGQASMKCVKQWQESRGMPATGVADIALVAQLAAA